MIYHFICPRCKQEHAILDRAVFLGLATGKGILFDCPLKHEQIILYFSMKIEVPTECNKDDLRTAEEEAESRNHQWKMEEDILGNKDTGR